MKGKSQTILIKCDFPRCRGEFKTVKDWENHYVKHAQTSEYVNLQEVSAEGGRSNLLKAVSTRVDQIVEPGMQIVSSKQPILNGMVDFLGRDSQKRLCLIDVAPSAIYGPKGGKLIRFRDHLKRLAVRCFDIEDPTIRCFIVTESGVIEV